MQTVKINPNHRVVFIDGGYLLFYRWHATQRWISFQKEAETMMTNATTYFANHLASQIAKMTKTLKVPKSNLVFCMDSTSQSIWRHRVAETGGVKYKGTRVSGVIPQETYNIYSQILHEHGHVVRVDRLEADDIVALLLRRVPIEIPVTIITSDHDYLQLQREAGGEMEIMSAVFKPIKGLSEDPEVNLWAKIFMGDPADNIPPAIPRCGKKTAVKLAEDPVKREETIEKYRMAVELNQSLVDFNMIPGELKDALNAAVELQCV